MTSLSLYQNKKRRPISPSFLPHINETILLMGPHSRQNLSTSHVISYSVLFLESCKIHRGLPFHLPIVLSLTCYNNSSHSREPSISLSLSYIYIPQYLQSLPFILTNQSRMSRVLRARRTTTWRPFFSSQSRKGFDFISTLHAHLLGSPYLHSYERSPLGGLRPSSVPLSRLH